MAIKVTCDVPTYNNPAKGDIRVHSHWNSYEMVEIEIGGERYEVYGKDLITAINDCDALAYERISHNERARYADA